MCARQIHLPDLPIVPVNPASPIPLYYQVEADLRALLKSPHVHSGDLLPTEIELAQAYGVGRHTIRTALGRLAADQLISRKAGHGTIINTPRDQRQFSLARSFTRQMIELGLQPRSVTLHQTDATVQPTDPHALAARVGAPCLHLHRLRFGGDEPIGLQYSLIVTEHCPGLGQRRFEGESLYHTLSHEYHLTITEIKHSITAVSADRKKADLLHVELRAPLLMVHTSAYLASGEIIEFSTSYYRAERYEYTTTHTSTTHPAAVSGSTS